jgi:hypothetical protein
MPPRTVMPPRKVTSSRTVTSPRTATPPRTTVSQCYEGLQCPRLEWRSSTPRRIFRGLLEPKDERASRPVFLIFQFIVSLACMLQTCSIQDVSFRECSEVKTGNSFRQRTCGWSASVQRIWEVAILANWGPIFETILPLKIVHTTKLLWKRNEPSKNINSEVIAHGFLTPPPLRAAQLPAVVSTTISIWNRRFGMHFPPLKLPTLISIQPLKIWKNYSGTLCIASKIKMV